MKQCCRCLEIKPLTGFYVNSRSKGGYLTICRACVNLRQREYEAKNREEVREKMRAYNIKNREKLAAQHKAYNAKNKEKLADRKREIDTGFSRDLFDRTLVYQNHLCAICKKDLRLMKKQTVHADHCHFVCVPRGILCQSCNTSLGAFGDDPAVLRRAIQYLEDPPVAQLQRLK